MKALRIVLQFVILAAGGVGLAALALTPNPDAVGIAVFLGAVAFLFALTLALKEHTENRLVFGRRLSRRPMGIALLLLGAFGLFYGFSFYAGAQALPDGSSPCRAVCGLILLATQSYGETAGRVVACALWSSVGLFLLFVGYQLTTTTRRIRSAI